MLWERWSDPLSGEQPGEKLPKRGGILNPEAGFGGFDSDLDGQQAQPAEFKHALVGEIIAGTKGDFVVIVLLEHPGDGGSLYYFQPPSPPPSSFRDAP